MNNLHFIGEIPNRPERIISLASSFTEILFFLGLEPKVVGVTNNSAGLNTETKEKVGTFAHPDFETILRLNPDLVLTKARTDEHFLQRCQESRIPVMMMNYSNVADVLDGMEEIADIAGVENGNELVDSLRRRVMQAASKTGLRRPRVYRMMITPLMTPTLASYQSDAIRIAGGEPFSIQSKDAYAHASLADVIAFDPEIILSCGQNTEHQKTRRCSGCTRPDPPCMRSISDISTWAEWKHTWAAKNRCVFTIPCESICHPGPRLVDGIEWMSKIFQGNTGES